MQLLQTFRNYFIYINGIVHIVKKKYIYISINQEKNI